MTTELTIMGLVPGMNELFKMHWTKRNRLREQYQKLFMSQTRNRHPGRVTVHIWRHSSGTMDADNLMSTAKLICDAMKLNKIIIDDKPEIIGKPICEPVKISPKVQPYTVIRITDI